ncbi:MAG: hypothetical protein CMJ76_09920 [Planctomycetaceae bacterium]|nr:hypothetical protein [Planctomycetaceae bacterium]|tara:strand:+ start:1491 stop:1925 length:435 start_codon:yes stop_codon:yes gene_type:complete
MKKAITMMVAILVAHMSLGDAKAQDFGFPFTMNNGSTQWNMRGNGMNQAPFQMAPRAVRARNVSNMQGSSSQFQDLLQQIQRASGVQSRQASRRVIYHREIERMEIEEHVNEQSVFNIENMLNQFRQGSSEQYRNRNRNRFVQR